MGLHFTWDVSYLVLRRAFSTYNWEINFLRYVDSFKGLIFSNKLNILRITKNKYSSIHTVLEQYLRHYT